MNAPNRKLLTVSVAALGALFLVVAIVRTVAAGPQTGPNAMDAAKARRVLDQGPRIDVPRGAFIAGSGVVEPADREIKVGGATAGRVAVVQVKEGDLVEAGTVVAELESGLERAALDVADAEVRTAKAELVRVARGLRKEDVDALTADASAQRARLELARAQLARTQRLLDEGSVAAEELERQRRQVEAETSVLDSLMARRSGALAGRPEDVSVASARLAAASARREQARQALERLFVRSPSRGAVLAVKIRAGELYAAGGQGAVEPIVVVGDTSRLRVRVDVDERDIGSVMLGLPAFVLADAFPGRRFGGRVVEVGRRMGRKNVRTDDPTERIDTKILEVVVELDDASGLVPGLRVTAYLGEERAATRTAAAGP